MTSLGYSFAHGVFGACAISAIAVAIAAVAAPSPSAKREDGLAQWRVMESVMMSPRCSNCHTQTNFPRQGDDRHRHNFEVVRGPEGHGVPGSQCAMCHHDTNSDASGVPGAPGWHLAPLSMQWERAPGVPMTSRELCALMNDQTRNGHRSAEQLVEHNATEALVLWAWSPGKRADGTQRQTPPISHDAFVAATRAWAKAGSPCP
ncbi:hypothetical protein [Rhizobium sp. ZPR3]|uniref:Isoquinoline 1-oxidoreductase subunit n=2 Tax=unclassified Rhizobium TaxID=2613769 RepID=A0AAU7SI40_9HYPH